jgi:hypothetical protein
MEDNGSGSCPAQGKLTSGTCGREVRLNYAATGRTRLNELAPNLVFGRHSTALVDVELCVTPNVYQM